jgi:flagellar basal body-associated protein FliL
MTSPWTSEELARLHNEVMSAAARAASDAAVWEQNERNIVGGETGSPQAGWTWIAQLIVILAICALVFGVIYFTLIGAQQAAERVERQAKEREEMFYNSAKENERDLLRYVDTCIYCEYKPKAAIKLQYFEEANRDKQIYLIARGKPDELQQYIRDCNLCLYKAQAENELAGSRTSKRQQRGRSR